MKIDLNKVCNCIEKELTFFQKIEIYENLYSSGYIVFIYENDNSYTHTYFLDDKLFSEHLNRDLNHIQSTIDQHLEEKHNYKRICL